MSEKMFPIQPHTKYAPHPMQIPWSVAEIAYSTYVAKYGRCQTLERLAERGGFSPGEMDVFCPDWRARCDVIVSLRQQVADLTTRAETAEKAVFTQSQKVIEEGSKVWVLQSQLRKAEAECGAMREAVRVLGKRVRACEHMLACYRVGRRPSEIALDTARSTADAVDANLLAAAAVKENQHG